MQPNFVKSFRLRLERAGFKNICIYRFKYGFYSVHCIAPNGVKIERLMSKLDMDNCPHLVYFDELT